MPPIVASACGGVGGAGGAAAAPAGGSGLNMDSELNQNSQIMDFTAQNDIYQ